MAAPSWSYSALHDSIEASNLIVQRLPVGLLLSDESPEPFLFAQSGRQPLSDVGAREVERLTRRLPLLNHPQCPKQGETLVQRSDYILCVSRELNSPLHYVAQGSGIICCVFSFMYKPDRHFSNLIMAGSLVRLLDSFDIILVVYDPPMDEFIARPLDLMNSDSCSILGTNGKHLTRYDRHSSHIKHGTLKSRE